MFQKPGVLAPCNLFSIGHILLILLTITLIRFALHKTEDFTKEQIHTTIKVASIILWVLEIIKISFALSFTDVSKVNEYVPLYFCSMTLYATLMAAFGKGSFKRCGEVFMMTGAIVGGLVFMIFPTTSLPRYPWYHFISLHSFFYHGTMVFLGLLMLRGKYITLERHDIHYHARLVAVMCFLALIVNVTFDGNLMFISKNFPGTPLEILYNLVGPLYTPIMVIGQMFLPFLVVYYGIDFLSKKYYERKEITAN